MLAAPVWHFWIGLILLVLTVAGIFALTLGYLKTVSSKRYPPQSRELLVDDGPTES